MKLKHYLMVNFILTAILLMLIATIPHRFGVSISLPLTFTYGYMVVIAISLGIMALSSEFCFSIGRKLPFFGEFAVNQTREREDLATINILDSWSITETLGKIGYWRFDALKGNLYCSQGLFDLLGIEACPKNPDITGFLQSTGQDKRSQILDLFFEGKTGANCQAIDYPVQKEGENGRYFFQAAIPKKGFNGLVSEVEGIIQDITKTSSNASNWRELESNLKAVFESDIAAIIILDPEGAISNHNRRARELFEQNSNWKCRVRENLMSLWEKEDDQQIRQLFCNARSGKVEKYEKKFTRTDGNTVWTYFSLIPLYEKSVITGVCITGRDITENKNYQLKIEEQNRVLYDIAWMQSHMARAPLARIISLTQIIHAELKPDYHQQLLLSYLNSSCQELDGMIKKISALTESVSLLTDPQKRSKAQRPDI